MDSQINKCKCCLEEDRLLDLWDEYKCYGESVVYGNMITECFSLHLKKPKNNQQEYICETCVTRLNDAVTFKREILSSDVFLKALNKGSGIKNDIDSDVEIKTEYLDIEFLLDDECVDIKDAVFSDDETNVEIETRKGSSNKRYRYMQKDLESCLREIQENDTPMDDAASIFRVPLHIVRKEVNKLLKAQMRERPSKRIRSESTEFFNSDKTEISSKRIHPDSTDIKTNIKRKRIRSRRILSNPTSVSSQEQFLLNYINECSNATPIKKFNGRCYECYFCPLGYEDPAELKIHTRNEHRLEKLRTSDVFISGVRMDVTDLTCLLCHVDLNLITDLCDHLKLEHKMVFSDKVISYMVPLRFDSDEFKCAICKEEFVYFKLLNEHMRKHFRNFECELCGLGFITRKTIRAHIRRHNEGEFKCSYCPKVFFTRDRVRGHEKQVHLKIKRNKCSYCDEKFEDIVKKKKHESVAHGAKRRMFVCQACERQFHTQNSLKSHIKDYHLMIKNHKCAVCEQSYVSPVALRNHMVKHTKSKNYICKACGKSFRRRSSFAQHMHIHLNDKRYKCDTCGYSTSHKRCLTKHMSSKHLDLLGL